jgi:hypothetical protein
MCQAFAAWVERKVTRVKLAYRRWRVRRNLSKAERGG